MSSQTQLAALHATPQGSAELLSRKRQLDAARKIPELPETIRKLSESTRVYIFNVGPWKQQQLMGSLGTYVIPACPAGKEYSAPVVIDGIVSELYPINEGEYKRMMSDGFEVAIQIIGGSSEFPELSKQLVPSNSLEKYGVFVSRTNPPSQAAVQKAKARFRGECNNLINEANSALAQGPKLAEETIREQHFIAARELGKTPAECPWLDRSVEVRERKECGFCGVMVAETVVKCPNCHEILDREAYNRMKGSAK